MRKLTSLFLMVFALSIVSHAQSSYDPDPNAKPSTPKSLATKQLNKNATKQGVTQKRRPVGTMVEPQKRVYGKDIPGQYLVLLNDDFVAPFVKTTTKTRFTSRAQKAAAATKHSAIAKKKIIKYAMETMGVTRDDIIDIYTGAVTGFSVKVPNTKSTGFLMKSKSQKNINTVIQDVEVGTASVTSSAPIIEKDLFDNQETSWGKSLVGGCNCEKAKYWAWVLGTGIDMDHKDLNVVKETKYAVSFVPGESVDDKNGHGTHAAGVIAAKDNGFGTVGVAAGAMVVPVKVLSNSGGGSFAWVLAGLDHVALYAWRGDVANLSFTSSGYPPIDQAVIGLGKKGIYVTVAAGNNAKDVKTVSPARADGNKVYTVSAADEKYYLAGFSNYGSSVDFAAPGVNIKSTYKNNGYARLSGTSIASPHLAGALLAKRTCQNYDYYYKQLVKDKDSKKDKIVQVFE